MWSGFHIGPIHSNWFVEKSKTDPPEWKTFTFRISYIRPVTRKAGRNGRHTT